MDVCIGRGRTETGCDASEVWLCAGRAFGDTDSFVLALMRIGCETKQRSAMPRMAFDCRVATCITVALKMWLLCLFFISVPYCFRLSFLLPDMVVPCSTHLLLYLIAQRFYRRICVSLMATPYVGHRDHPIFPCLV